jgi:hypothetical protein
MELLLSAVVLGLVMTLAVTAEVVGYVRRRRASKLVKNRLRDVIGEEES